MKKSKQENMNFNRTKHFEMDEQHASGTEQEGRFFEFLFDLKEENLWDEKDFDSVFMYL